MNSTDFYLQELLDKEPVRVERVDLTEFIAALSALGHPPSAEEIARALSNVINIPIPVDPTPAIREAVDELKKVVDRIGGMRFGGGGPSEIRVKNTTSDPVQVYLTNPADISSGGGTPVVTGTTAGPASYSAGGFVIDVTDNYSTVSFGLVGVTVVGPNLPPCHFEYALNTPTAGKFTVKVMRHRYDKATATATGTPGGLPSGVTTRATSGGVAASIDAVGGTGQALHVNEVYSHTHSISLTQTATDAASTELAAGVNLSGTTFEWMAVGT